MLIGTICAFALVALVWSFFGRLDVHAVAQGKIETAGHSKVIEPLDPGKVAAIHVEAGQPVKAGDLLFEFDPAEAKADVRAARTPSTPASPRSPADATRSPRSGARRPRTRALARRATGPPGPQSPVRTPATAIAEPAAASQVEELAGRPNLDVAWDDSLPEPFRLREEAVLRADLTQLSDALKALDRQMAQKLATQKRLDMSIAFQHTLMDTLKAARGDPPGGDRQAASAPRSTFTTPRRNWRSPSRSSPPTRAS